MKNAYQQQQSKRVNTILSALPKQAEANLREFIHQFYAKVTVEDLERMDSQYAVALATSAYKFAEKRPSSEPKIRIFSPSKSQHGYESKHVVIELLNDDMPFLVDSLSSELSRQGLVLRETIHPIFHIQRDGKGQLKGLLSEADAKQGATESLIHFEVLSLPETLSFDQLKRDLELVLKHIRVAVEDWKAILEKANERIKKLEKAKGSFDKETVAEVEDFLRWLVNKNFVFLGYAEYEFRNTKEKKTFSVVPSSKLGIFRIEDEAIPYGIESMPEEQRHFLLVPQLIEITKSNRKSLVHRPMLMDYIGLKRFDTKGNVVGEARFLGLFTSNVYYQSAEMIPFARQKMAQVLKRSGFRATSHDGKSLKTILEFLPRDEILQMSTDDLFEVAMGILSLESRPGVRLFVRKDAFERFVSLMVFVPREQFSTDLRRQIQAIAEKAWNGTTSTFSTQITEMPLTRLHLIIKTTPDNIPAVDVQAVEREIAKCAYLWSDLLLEALLAKYGEPKAEKWRRYYASAFPQGYINRYDATAAAYDIKKIEDAFASNGLVLDLFRNRAEGDEFFHLKTYNPLEEIPLSDMLPILENCGFKVIDENPFQVTPSNVANPVWIRDFRLKVSGGITIPLEQVKPLLEEAMLKIWRREMENDRFNALVLTAGLTWRQVTMLRAYAKYLKQATFSSSQQAIEQAMMQHPAIAANIVALFEARFNPEEKNHAAKSEQWQKTIEEQLSNVSNAAEDRILRRYVQAMQATLRTNYFQLDKESAHKPVLSFKFNSSQVPDLPRPVPYAEIFVYGLKVEGIHLRGGKVARGGLRWSDRTEDFRTEVLGLMKAQMVKNSVIVPVGSKGGFIVKQPPASGSREALLEEGITCYKLYLQGLLDITDNIVKGKVIPPAEVVRHDGDDPYLVVAADKGTATFSDIANGVSKSYGFWLDDAFASGGSAGYDHKAMGITARGGWVSVMRHFQEMGVDICRQDFTCAGIGDMAGDVFGNGMLLSDRIRLVAAFNHQHIFIDPSPDAKASFNERKRLFKLTRSTWKDYKPELISKGGGIFERSAKSISLSKEAQAVLGVSKASLTPDEVIRAILMAPVDLLWNGGIGTYVKAEDETHEQVGDRANNAVRINGKDLRCKVVGEGGNLGFTQKGRIEYARSGGRINTDAIDNSAGVDCSDHEVNIKIALSQDIALGKLTLTRRDALLKAMTDDVAALVLKDNILQTQALTIAEQQGPRQLEAQIRLMHMLEQGGLLDRAIEFLPGDKQLADLEAGGRGLTRPELAVLLAYSKMSLYKQLLESTLPDESYFTADLKRYFPKAMQEEFASAIGRHPLKREIIATVMTNSLVNRAGITFWSGMAEDFEASARDVAVAYAIVRDAFGLRVMWKGIGESAGVNASVQAEMFAMVTRFLERASGWLLRIMPLPLDIDGLSKEIAPAVGQLEKYKESIHSEETRNEAGYLKAQLMGQSVPEALAEAISGLAVMSQALDIIAIANKQKLPVQEAGKAYFELGACLNLSWLRQGIDTIAASSYWERKAIQALANNLSDERRRIAGAALAHSKGIAGWLAAHEEDVTHLLRFMDELKSAGKLDLPRLTVALKQVSGLGVK